MRKLFKIFRKKKKINYNNYSLSGLFDFANNPDLYERKLLIERQRFDINTINGNGDWNITGSSVGIIRSSGWFLNE